MDAPALVETRFVVIGGFIKQPWVPDLITDDGKPYNNVGTPFIKLRTTSTPGFANMIGLGEELNGDLPREFLNYITNARNEQVDELIKDLRLSESQSTNDSALSTARHNWIDEISKTVTIDLPPISDKVGSCSMVVRTTSNFLSCVEMEFSQETITYLQHACAISWGDHKRKSQKSKEEWVRWPEFPAVRYADCPNAKRSSYIYVSYRSDDGRIHRKSFSPKRSDVPEVWEINCRSSAQEAQAFFEANHVPKQDGSARKRKHAAEEGEDDTDA